MSLPQTNTRASALAGVAAGGSVLVGTVVLLGWILDIPVLRTLLPAMTNPMVATTALGLVLCGLSLWLQRPGSSGAARWSAVAMAGAASSLGLLRIAEYAFGLDLGLDLTLLAERAGAFGGQMALPTAVSLALIGASLAVLDVETRRGWRPAQTLGLAGAVPAVMGLVGRLYGVPSLQQLAPGTVVMALHTALALSLLCAGIVASRPGRGVMRVVSDPGPAGSLVRGLLPLSALLMTGVGGLRLLGQRSGLYGTEFGTAAMVIFTIVLVAALVYRAGRSLLQSELQRRAAAERERSVLRSLGEGVAITDAQGRLVSMNPALERLLGRREADVIGRPYAEVVEVADAQGEPIALEGRLLLRAIASGEVLASRGFDLALLHRDGRRIPVSATAAPIRDATGEVVGGVDVIREVSHEHAVDELKSSLVSTVSHELRTPLTMIQGFSELLLARVQGDERTTHALEQINVSSQRLGRLIADLLSVSRIDSGRLEAHPEELTLREAVEEAIAPFRDGRPVTADVGDDLDVVADRDQLHQILTNLLSNAAKYSEEGSPITVTAARAGDRVEVRVTDVGIGMDQDELARLFEKFFRAGDERVRRTPGTGLGLYITRSLVELQGGSISVTSEAGRGSSFTFTLPMTSSTEARGGSREEALDR